MSFIDAMNEAAVQRSQNNQNQQRLHEEARRNRQAQEHTHRLLEEQNRMEKEKNDLLRQQIELEQQEIANANEYRMLLGYSQQVLAVLQTKI